MINLIAISINLSIYTLFGISLFPYHVLQVGKSRPQQRCLEGLLGTAAKVSCHQKFFSEFVRIWNMSSSSGAVTMDGQLI